MKLFSVLTFHCFFIPILTSCSQPLAQRLEEKPAIAIPSRAFEACYPKDQSKPARIVSVVSQKDKQTYWEVDAPSNDSTSIKEAFVRLNFRTNKYGKCEFLSDAQPGNRLKYMPEDAAVALAKLHYEPYLTKFLKKCTSKNSKDQCLKQFATYFEELQNSADSRTIRPPEDVKALKELGVVVKQRVDEDLYLKLKNKNPVP